MISLAVFRFVSPYNFDLRFFRVILLYCNCVRTFRQCNRHNAVFCLSFNSPCPKELPMLFKITLYLSFSLIVSTRLVIQVYVGLCFRNKCVMGHLQNNNFFFNFKRYWPQTKYQLIFYDKLPMINFWNVEINFYAQILVKMWVWRILCCFSKLFMLFLVLIQLYVLLTKNVQNLASFLAF